MLQDETLTSHSAPGAKLFSMMTSLKEAVISPLIWYLTQAATTGCVFLAATLFIRDPFAAVAHCQIFIQILFALHDPIHPMELWNGSCMLGNHHETLHIDKSILYTMSAYHLRFVEPRWIMKISFLMPASTSCSCDDPKGATEIAPGWGGRSGGWPLRGRWKEARGSHL